MNTNRPSAPTYLNTSTAADLLGVSRRMLEKLRLSGNGPIYCKIGRLVRYEQADLLAWASADRRTSTSDPGGSKAA